MKNNKPVAWMYAVNGIWTAFSDELPPDDAYDEGTLTPLYTHPHPDNLGLAESIIKQQQLKIDNLLENNARLDAEIEVLKAHPVKELTDEEIEECMGCLPKYNNEIVNEDLVKFARAILRKAQEK